MTAPLRLFTAPHANRLLAAGAALGAGACLLVVGCSAGPAATSAPSASGGGALAARSAPGGMSEPAAALPGAAAKPAEQTVLPPPAGQELIRTASLTVRAGDIHAAAARAAQLATSAGGYVSSETARFDRRHPDDGTISIQLKIPAARYQATLAVLSAHLGTRISLSQRAQDVTQTVADVTSRVTSAQAAIVQLRRLLARTGSVSSLLMVQNQINSQEAALEALQSRQRALAHETTYGTVSVLLMSRRPPPAAPPVKLAGGFTGGLAAGWHALRQVTSWLLTAIGAVLPFAVVAFGAAFAGLWGWRRLARHRAHQHPAS